MCMQVDLHTDRAEDEFESQISTRLRFTEKYKVTFTFSQQTTCEGQLR